MVGLEEVGLRLGWEVGEVVGVEEGDLEVGCKDGGFVGCNVVGLAVGLFDKHSFVFHEFLQHSA